MTHPLDGFDLKLNRADEHLQAVKNAVKAFVGDDSDLIPGEFDAKTRQYTFRATRDSRSATWLSPLIGDCVHNLRAALDYLIWEMAPVSARTGRHANRIEFPIFVAGPLYNTESPKKIGGIPLRAQAIIKKLQPFAGPNSQPWHPDWREPEEEPLAVLYELDKWDKHRSLNLTEDVISGMLEIDPEEMIFISPAPSVLAGRFERGAVLARATLGPDHPQMKMNLRCSYDVAFDSEGPAAGESAIKTLANIRQEVRKRVFPALAQFFPRR